jgi:hypothetical protein
VQQLLLSTKKMDALSRTYAALLAGTYDCLDRIVVNAYFRMGHDAGGFRVWWRKLTGSEETVHLVIIVTLWNQQVGYAQVTMLRRRY